MGLILILKVKITAVMASTIAFQSVNVSFDIITKTASIIATAATFTAFKKCLNTFDFCIFGMNGFKIKTNRKEGRNIPAVAANAP